jgi:uncharacterized protein with PQ loop repeat
VISAHMEAGSHAEGDRRNVQPSNRPERCTIVVEMLAWCGAALSCLLSVPQAIRVLHGERLDGISASTYVIVLSNTTVWAAWSLFTGEYAAGVPGLINGPAAILILHRLVIARRRGRITNSDGGLLVRMSRNLFGVRADARWRVVGFRHSDAKGRDGLEPWTATTGCGTSRAVRHWDRAGAWDQKPAAGSRQTGSAGSPGSAETRATLGLIQDSQRPARNQQSPVRPRRQLNGP